MLLIQSRCPSSVSRSRRESCSVTPPVGLCERSMAPYLAYHLLHTLPYLPLPSFVIRYGPPLQRGRSWRRIACSPPAGRCGRHATVVRAIRESRGELGDLKQYNSTTIKSLLSVWNRCEATGALRYTHRS